MPHLVIRAICGWFRLCGFSASHGTLIKIAATKRIVHGTSMHRGARVRIHLELFPVVTGVVSHSPEPALANNGARTRRRTTAACRGRRGVVPKARCAYHTARRLAQRGIFYRRGIDAAVFVKERA